MKSLGVQLTEGKKSKKLVLNNLDVFSRTILSHIKKDLEKTPKHIEKWYSELDGLKDGQKVLRLSPRGSAKSTTHTINYPIREIYKDNNIRVVIASNTLEQAKGFLYEIKEHLERNELLKTTFGDLVPIEVKRGQSKKWTENKIIINRNYASKDATVSTCGVGGAVLSRRCDLMIMDDILDEENTATVGQREKIKTWFLKVALPVLVPQGKLIIIGTRWHFADLYSELIKQAKLYDINVVAVEKALDGDKSYWPERYTVKWLTKQKNANPDMFNCSYQNNPTGQHGSIFKLDNMKWYEDVNIKALDIYFIVDPAISKTDTADYSVINIIGVDNRGFIYTIEIVRDRLTEPELIDLILNKVIQYKPMKIGVESVAYQKGLKQFLDKETRERQLYVNIVELIPDKDKIRRARVVAGWFEQGLIYLRRDMHDAIDELTQFPKAEHDDIVDTFSYIPEMVMSKSNLSVDELRKLNKEDNRNDNRPLTSGFYKKNF